MSVTAKQLVAFHKYMMYVWTLLLPLTMISWRDSIPWVVFMSWYANWVGHFSGWDSARAEEKIDG